MAEEPAACRRARRLLWRPHDLGFAALRRALPAALVIPLAMAFALLDFHHAQVGNHLDQARVAQPHGQQVNEAVLQAAVLDALRRWKEDPAAEQAAVAIIAGGLWIRDLATLAANQEEAALKVIEAARMPSWR